MSSVLYLLPSATPGGAERATMRMVSAHRQSRFAAGVLFFSDGPLVAEARALNASVSVLASPPRLSRPWSVASAIRECARLIRAERYDIVHSCMSYCHFVGGPAAAATGSRAVFYQHGPVGSWMDAVAPVLPCDGILAASQFVAAQQRARSWRSRPDALVPLAVDVTIDQKDRAALRQRVEASHDIPHDAFVVGIVARFDPWKGIDFGLRAVAPLLHHRPGMRLMIVGGQYRHFHPHYGDVLRSIASEERVFEQVVFTGFQLDMRPYLARLDALVHAAVQPEPFGLTIVEAMASGVPVLAANAGGPREIIEHDVNGLLYAPGNAGALREALLRVLDDEALRNRLTAAAAGTVETRYRSASMMAALDAVYDGLCPPPA